MTMAALHLIGRLVALVYYRFIFDGFELRWSSFDGEIALYALFIIGITVFLLEMRRRMRMDGEVIEDGQWRLLSVIAITMASFRFLPMVLFVLSYQLAMLEPMGQLTWSFLMLEMGYIVHIMVLLIGFIVYLAIGLRALGRIRFRLAGDPFALPNRTFLCLVSLLAVIQGEGVLSGIGWFYVFADATWASAEPVNFLTIYNPAWFIYSVVLVVGTVPAFLYFRKRMREKGEVMDREQWHELAFMALGLFVLNVYYLHYAAWYFFDLLRFIDPFDEWYYFVTFFNYAGIMFYSIALLAIGLYARKRSKEEAPIEVAAVAMPG